MVGGEGMPVSRPNSRRARRCFLLLRFALINRTQAVWWTSHAWNLWNFTWKGSLKFTPVQLSWCENVSYFHHPLMVIWGTADSRTSWIGSERQVRCSLLFYVFQRWSELLTSTSLPCRVCLFLKQMIQLCASRSQGSESAVWCKFACSSLNLWCPSGLTVQTLLKEWRNCNSWHFTFRSLYAKKEFKKAYVLVKFKPHNVNIIRYFLYEKFGVHHNNYWTSTTCLYTADLFV